MRRLDVGCCHCGAGKALTLSIVLGIAAGIFLLGASWVWNEAFRLILPLLAALIIWIVMLAFWHLRSARMDAAAHEKGMYFALTVWAVIDISILISRYGSICLPPSTGTVFCFHP